jgi:hypothetical protein
MLFDEAMQQAAALSLRLAGPFPVHAFGGALAQSYWGLPGEVAGLEVFVPCRYGEERPVAQVLAPGQEALAERYRQVVSDTVRYILCALDFEESLLRRTVLARGVPLVSAEDHLLLCLFRFRQGVEGAVTSIMMQQRGRLQWPYVEHWLPQLAALKEEPRMMTLLARLRGAS